MGKYQADKIHHPQLRGGTCLSIFRHLFLGAGRAASSFMVCCVAGVLHDIILSDIRCHHESLAACIYPQQCLVSSLPSQQGMKPRIRGARGWRTLDAVRTCSGFELLLLLCRSQDFAPIFPLTPLSPTTP